MKQKVGKIVPLQITFFS